MQDSRLDPLIPRKKNKLSNADIQCSNLTEQLTEDRKFFWHDLIRAMEPVYEIRKRKSRVSKKSKK